MKHFLITSIFTLFLSSGLVIANENVSDEKISEISLQNLDDNIGIAKTTLEKS